MVDTPQHDQRELYKELKEKLLRSDEGWYESAPPWKDNHSPLPLYKQGSLRLLEDLKLKIKRMGVEEAYSKIIKHQKAEGIVEAADQQAQGVECYILNKPVIREEAASSWMRFKALRNKVNTAIKKAKVFIL